MEFLIENDVAGVIKYKYPKAEYHYLIICKENIPCLTALKLEHLSLLEKMNELANEIIKQQNVRSSQFLIGFKLDAYKLGLNMHVLSNDFYSLSMRRKQHWNTFNSDLFMSYQAAYALIGVQGYIDPMPEEKINILLNEDNLHCNQCDLQTNSICVLKLHLFQHWKERDDKLSAMKEINRLTHLLDENKLDDVPKLETANTAVNELPEKPAPLSWRQNMGQSPTDPQKNAIARHFQKPAKKQAAEQPQLLNQNLQQQFNINSQRAEAQNAIWQQGPNWHRPQQAFNQQMQNGICNSQFNQHTQPRLNPPFAQHTQPHFNPFKQTPNQIHYPRPNVDNVRYPVRQSCPAAKYHWPPKPETAINTTNDKFHWMRKPDQQNAAKPATNSVENRPKPLQSQVQNNANNDATRNKLHAQQNGSKPPQSQVQKKTKNSAFKPKQADVKKTTSLANNGANKPTQADVKKTTSLEQKQNQAPKFEKNWNKNKKPNTSKASSSEASKSNN
ncbi:CG5316 [Drosophila busckii]|uniref:CG5316 n=1 Tax=Drosophila busckii TaxID=30019 RepID=A0A0M4EN54_DROBS|nr:aprataxin-like protein [Drosophila busckii]ALC46990.1 CG5316 [Drosophila busckii]